MDTIRIAGAQFPIVADRQVDTNDAQGQPPAEIRILADWELAMAGGGENFPEWQ